MYVLVQREVVIGALADESEVGNERDLDWKSISDCHGHVRYAVCLILCAA